MNSMNRPEPELDQSESSDFDQAMSRRLARLATRPVDTSRVERRLLAEIARTQPAPLEVRGAFRWSGWRTVAGIAAVLLLGIFIGIVATTSTSPVVAAPGRLAEIHLEATSDAAKAIRVSSLDEANRELASQTRSISTLPRKIPGEIRSCCLHDVGGVIAACVVVEYRSQLITIVVAHGRDLCSADGQVTRHRGQRFMVHEVNGVRMAMASRGDHWLCVMGDVAADQLLEVAGEIEF